MIFDKTLAIFAFLTVCFKIDVDSWLLQVKLKKLTLTIVHSIHDTVAAQTIRLL